MNERWGVSTVSETGVFARNRFTWLAYTVLGFYAFFQVGIGVVMPSLRDELNLSYATSSLHFSAFALGLVVAGIFGDRLTRLFGRGLVFWGGGVGMALGAAAFALSGDVVITISCSFLMGLLGTIAVGVLNAGLSDQHGRWRAVALTESNAAASIFATLTPLMVGLFQHVDLGWRGALFLPAFLLMLLALRYYEEPLPKPQGAREKALGGRKLPRSYWIYWTAIVFLDSVEFCTVYWGASFLENAVGLNRSNASTALSVFIVGMVLGRLVGSRLNRALPSGLILSASFGLALVGFPIFWLAPLPALNVAGLFLLGLGISNIYPLIVSAAVGAVPGNTDAATARFLLAVGIAILVPPFALGFVADLVDIRYAYGLVAPLLIAALVTTLLASRASAPRARAEYEVTG